MLDLVLGVLLVLLAVRGWTRGLVREVIGLAVLVVGTVLAFRLSTPLGRVFAAMSGASPDASRVVAGIFIFLGLSVAAAIVSRVLHLGIRLLPGVSTVNRAAGAALSLAAFALLVTLTISLAAVLPLPEAVADELDASAVAATLTEPDGVPQRVLGFLSGDRVVEISLRIQELTGASSAVATVDSPISIPPVEPDDLKRHERAEDVTFDLLNRERVAHDVAAVLRSSGLNEVAYRLAAEGYVAGSLTVRSSEALRQELDAAGLLSTARGQFAVLAASPEAGHAALVAEPVGALLADGFTKVGIGVARGPYGLLIVGVLTG